MQARNLICSVFLMCSTLTVANSHSDNALAIYQNSSAEIRTEQFSANIAKQFLGMASGTTQIHQGVQSQILDVIERTYHSSMFEKHIARSIENTLNRQERNRIIQWLDTPVARKASLANAVALLNATNEGIPTTIDKATGLESTAKAALVDVAELAAMDSALQLDISVNLTSASAFAANAPKSPSSIKDFSIFEAATDARRREIGNLNNNYSRSLLSLTYADFSKAEVEAMISFWGSPTGTRLSVALRQGINDAFEEANSHFNREVKRIVSASTVAAR